VRSISNGGHESKIIDAYQEAHTRTPKWSLSKINYQEHRFQITPKCWQKAPALVTMKINYQWEYRSPMRKKSLPNANLDCVKPKEMNMSKTPSPNQICALGFHLPSKTLRVLPSLCHIHLQTHLFSTWQKRRARVPLLVLNWGNERRQRREESTQSRLERKRKKTERTWRGWDRRWPTWWARARLRASSGWWFRRRTWFARVWSF